jgi:cytochrome c553
MSQFMRLVSIFLVLVSGMASAGEHQIPDFDPDDAEEIMEVCAGCHGVYAQGTRDGEYPRLAGLDPAYLAREIRLFKERKRINIPMIPYANDHELPPEDVRTITAYLASIQLPRHMSPLEPGSAFDALARLEESKKVLNVPHYPGDPERGGKLYRRECGSCHGRHGEGDWEEHVPMLTGQHSDYLLRQIENIRKGERLHDDPEDAELFREYSDQDIADILAWLSWQDD